MKKTKKRIFKASEPEFKMLAKSEILTAKNGNSYVLLVVEVKWEERVQVQHMAFFL